MYSTFFVFMNGITVNTIFFDKSLQEKRLMWKWKRISNNVS